MSGVEDLHLVLLLLQKWIAKQEHMTDNDCASIVSALVPVADKLSTAHVWTVKDILWFLGADSQDVDVIIACVEGGHAVSSALIRLLIRHNESVDVNDEAPDLTEVVGASPKSRKFAALATARTSVEQLLVVDWFPKLSGVIDKLCGTSPQPLRAVLTHASARLVCKPSQSASLYQVAAAAQVLFPVLIKCLKQLPSALRDLGLLRSMLTFSSTVPYSALPLKSEMVADAAINVAALLLPSNLPPVRSVCSSWRLRKTKLALDLASREQEPITVFEGTFSDITKWLLSTPLSSISSVAELLVSMALAEVPRHSFACALALASDHNHKMLRAKIVPKSSSYTDVIKYCVRLLPSAGSTPLVKQLLLFAMAGLEHPEGMEAERAVLNDILANDAQRLRSLVTGVAEGEEECSGDAGYANLCKRWLCSVIAGDPDLKQRCRDCLIEGLPLCLQSGYTYLAACAEVCAGGAEAALITAVVKAFKQHLQSNASNDARYEFLLPILEFIKATLSAVVRVDSKGWFAQPAAALAEVLVCLKFCHRALRSNAGSTKAGLVPSALTMAPLEHKYEQGFGCSYSRTKEEYVMMHWYLCYSTYQSERKGACSWCAEYCHRRRGYDVEYAGCIPAYCDTKGIPPVQPGCSQAPEPKGALPHEATDPFVQALFHPPPSCVAAQQINLPADFILQLTDIAPLSELLGLLQSCVNECLPIANRMLNETFSEKGGANNHSCVLTNAEWRTHVAPRHLVSTESSTILESAVDGRLEYDAMPHYEINLLQSRVLTRHVAASSLCGWVALVDRSQSVLIVDEGASFPVSSISPPRRGDAKPELSILARNTLRFKVIGMALNPLNGMYLAAYGVHNVHVFVVSGGSVILQIAPQLALSMLSGSTHVIHCAWLPSSHTHLAVVTTKFVKVFDLSADIYCPVNNYMLLEGEFAAATFGQDTDGSVTMFGITTTGQLYSQVVTEGDSVDGPFYLTNVVDVPAKAKGDSGCSVYYSNVLNTLCVAYSNGKAFFARWDFSKASLEDLLQLPLSCPDRSLWSINRWEECIDAPGVLACILNDGANVGVISLDKKKQTVTVEVHDLHGSSTHAEGIALVRHRAPPPVAGTIPRTRPAPLEQLNLLVSLESGTVCSYPLDTGKLSSITQSSLLSEELLGDIEKQKSSILTARPIPRTKARRPGGKASGRPETERDREREKAEEQQEIEQQPDGAFEALLLGRPLSRGAPFDTVPYNTLRAMSAFDAKWGGLNTRSDVPSTVALNVWEDLMPLGRTSWSITRGVGVSAEDKDKLADGSDLTCVTVMPPRALSKGPSVDGGTSPPLKGLATPGISPCSSPPLSPLSQRSTSPLTVGLSPMTRALGDRAPPPGIGLGIGVGDARPAARFVLQASGEAVICGVRLRLSCGKEQLPGRSPGECSLPTEDQQVVIRVASQTRTLSSETATRWLGFVLTHREAMKTTKQGVEVSIVTNGPEVVLKQIELFTCVSNTRSRPDEGRASPDPQEKEQESRERVNRFREPVSPLTSASSTLDAILQNLVSGRAGALSTLARKKAEETKQAQSSQPSQRPAQQSPPAPVTPREEPVAKIAPVHTVLLTALGCIRLIIAASEDVCLDDDTRVALWRSTIDAAKWGAKGPVVETASAQSMAALHALFAGARHKVSTFRLQRATTMLHIACTIDVNQANRVQLILATASATLNFRNEASDMLGANKPLLMSFRRLIDNTLSIVTSEAGKLPTGQENALAALQLLSVIDLLTSIRIGDTAGEAAAVQRLTSALISVTPVSRMSALYVIRQLLADKKLDVKTFSYMLKNLLELKPRADKISGSQAVPYYNSLLCVLSKIVYPTEGGAPDIGSIDAAVVALLPQLSLNTSCDEFGVTPIQFLNIKTLTMLLGASFSPPSLRVLPSESKTVEEDRQLQLARLVSSNIDQKAQVVLKELVFTLLRSRKLCDPEAALPTASSDQLLPLTPPVYEQSRITRDEGAEITSAAPPPASCDLIAKGASDFCLNNLQPLFSPVLSAQGNSILNVYTRHTLVATLQLVGCLHSTGNLEDLNTWKGTIVEALRNDGTKFMESELKALLVALCNHSLAECQDYRDDMDLKKEHAALSGIVKNMTLLSSVDYVLSLHSSLEAMTTIAAGQPKNWITFCREEPSVVGLLVTLLRHCLPPELAAHALRLLAFVVKPTAKIDSVGPVVNPKFMKFVIQEYLLKSITEQVLNVKCSLDDSVNDCKAEVIQLLRAIGIQGEGEAAVAADNANLLAETLLDLLPGAASSGTKGAETLLKLAQESLNALNSRDAALRMAGILASAVRKCCVTILRHPRTPLYLSVERALGASKGCVLEGGWAQDGSVPPARLTEASLGTLGADIKYAPDTIFVRLSSAIQLKRVMLLVSDCKQSKVPKVVEVWHSSQYSPDARAVRDPSFQWHLLGRITVDSPSSICRAAVELPLVVTAHALKLHFAEFDCDPSAQQTETLTCPSCNQIITDRHGQCLNCEYENAYQCRQCRNINHEQLDAFLCNECGWCRYGRVDFSLLCRTSAAPDVLRNESDRVRALQVLGDNNVTAQQLTMQLTDLRTNASVLVSQLDLNTSQHMAAPSSSPRQARPVKDKQREDRKVPEEEMEGMHPSAIALASLYNNSAKEITTQLAKCLRTQSELRRVIFKHAAVGKTTSAGDEDVQLSPSSQPSSPKGTCDTVDVLLPTHYGSLSQLCVLFLEATKSLLNNSHEGVQEVFLSDDLFDVLYVLCVQGPDAVKGCARDVLIALQKGNRCAMDKVLRRIKEHVMSNLCDTSLVKSYNAAPLHAAMALLTGCAGCKDGLWFKRLPLLLQLFLKVASEARAYPYLLDAITQSALNFAGTLLVSSQESVPTASLAAKYGRKWLNFWLLRTNKDLAALASNTAWLTELMLAPSLSSIGQQVRRTAESLAMADSALHAGLLKTLVERLPQVAKDGRVGGSPEVNSDTEISSGTEAFFSLLHSLVSPLWVRVLFTRRGILPFICRLILREAYYLAELETDIQKAAGGDGCVPVELGWSINKLAGVLAVFIPSTKEGDKADKSQVLFSRILKQGNGVAMLLDASLTLKSIAAVRTKQISNAETLIKGVLDTLVTESNADKSSFITASVTYLAKPRLTCQMGKHILEKVLNIVDPKPPEEVCQLLFKKKPSQEDFIRGHMGNLPVPSNTVGKTMADVASKICRELDLQLDPDFGLELLVDSKIIDLKLPIQLVYNQVWKEASSSKMNSGGTLPMLVVYRLQGLDGEATEERVDRLEEPEVLEDEPSVKYAITECLAQSDALKTLVRYVACVCELLKGKGDMIFEWELLIATLTLLHICCQVKANRVALAEQRSLHVMLSAVDICGNRSGESAHTALQLLLSIAGSIAGEMGSDNVGVDSGADQHLEFCVSHLEQHYSSYKAQLPSTIAYQRIDRSGLSKAEHHLYDVLRLISAVVSGNKRAVERVDTYFTPFVNAAIENGDETAVFYTQCLAVIVRALGRDTCGEIRKRLHTSGMVAKLLQVVKKDPKDKTSSAAPAVLRLLEALVRATGDPLDFYTSILAVVTKLHSLEKKGKKQEIASAATAVLDALRECGQDNGQVDKVRKQTKKSKHDAAMALREKVLRDLNRQAHAEIDLDDVGDEDGLVCLICREVATFRPQDVLGIYMFARRVDILTNTAPNDPHCTFMSLNPPARTTAYSSVTHFNAVHFSCHKDAVQIDAGMRPAKREWEGATVRNLKTRCNSILPVKVTDTSQTQYHRCAGGFADRVGFTRGRGQLSMFEQSVYDIRMLLSRACWGHSYSTDSKGGGPEHNFSVVPFMIQISMHYLDTDSAEHERSKAASLLSHFISGAATPFLFHADAPAATSITSEFIFYLLTVSIMVMSMRQWVENKYFIVRNLVAYLLSTYVTKQGRSKPLQLVFGDLLPPGLPAANSTSQSLLTGIVDRGRLDEYDDDEGEEWATMRDHGNVNLEAAQVCDVSSEQGLLAFLKPALVFVCVLDGVQSALKGADVKIQDPHPSPTTTHTAEWVTAFTNRLQSQQTELTEAFLTIRRSINDEFLQCTTLQEFLDILGILPQVLTEAPTAEQWATQFLA
eukprot:TRINITY_DN4419_c0_g1_i1.p1 TRINITY_DN4419_c0_g1~~TRINITY_DN4419_c0_g1_i1.p1  ORF type:complete len:4765 (+),score=1100.59 TRINITY_DN4419_c0_g1_i1:2077-14295(+)